MSIEVDEPRIRKAYVPNGDVGMFFTAEQDMSNADLLATLTDEERAQVFSDLSEEDMAALEHDPDFWLRPSQLALVNSKQWMTVALAGRGWGKSHVLSVAMHKYAMENPGSRLILSGRTTSDVRDVMIFGSSGIMSVVDPEEKPRYNPATRKLTWSNGTYALCYSAERPDAFRGAQAHASFCDEIAAYRDNPGSGLANAFDQIRIATRLTGPPTDEYPQGKPPQIFVATTPKRVPMILDLVKQAEEEPDKVLLVRGPTAANRALSSQYKETIEGMYAGTALGKQELEGELLTDVEGSLLSQPVIDGTRIDPAHEDHDPHFWASLPLRVIGVDPSVSSTPNDECGIIAVASTGERKLYKRNVFVLEDASVLGPPDVWAKRVVQMARKYRAVVVAEKNQGGEMVRMIIKQQDPMVPVVLVHAAVAKEQRAEPVGTAYERGNVQHVGHFPELEAQLTSWAPKMGLASPDRMDALVHAVTQLVVAPSKEMIGAVRVTGDPSRQQLTGVKDHSPGGPKPREANLLPEDADPDTDENGKPRQIVFNQMHRRSNLPIGQRDPRLGGASSYTAPNRFGVGPNPYRRSRT